MGDPLNEQDELLPVLRRVLDAAGPYFEGLPERLVYDRVAEPLLAAAGEDRRARRDASARRGSPTRRSGWRWTGCGSCSACPRAGAAR